MIDRKPTFEFTSIYAPHVREFIEIQESLGYKVILHSVILRQFDRYCVEIGRTKTVLDDELVANWMARYKNNSHWTRCLKISTLKKFSNHLKTLGVEVQWSPHPGYVNKKRKYIPYIYTVDEIRRIFQCADHLLTFKGKTMFHIEFPAILKILYCCGLRLSEALTLKVQDVDLEHGLIFIKKAKYGNERRLPITSSLLTVLRAYRAINQDLIGIDSNGYFFPTSCGEKYHKYTFYEKFRTILWQSDIPHQGKGKGPRVHDLRHTFAIHSLQKSILAGVDVYASLPVLMTYLGHSHINSTEYYLRMTAELYPDFLTRADTVCSQVIPEVVDYED